MDYLHPDMSRDKLHEMSSSALAHVGDGVYELMVRTWLSFHGKSTSAGLHRAAISHVSAGAQARALQKIFPLLTEEEQEIYRRGRNANSGAVPQSASPEEYHTATGLEALFGSLYLQGRKERLGELFAVIMGD